MNLETEFAGVNFDVTKLNSQVKIWVQQLQARGETTQDLLANLLRAYKTLPDSEIVDYVKQKTNDYDEGQEFTADSLMHLVGNKYATRSNEKDFEDGRKDQDSAIPAMRFPSAWQPISVRFAANALCYHLSPFRHFARVNR